jgi:hypothetical protein
MHQLDALTGEQSRRAALQTVLDAVNPLRQGFDVDFGLLLLETHPLEAPGERDGATGGDHRLRRDAVPQMRGAADDITFDERHLGTEARRVRRCRVACGATADDHESSRHNGRGYPSCASPGPCPV